jgi:hypothetical protein
LSGIIFPWIEDRGAAEPNIFRIASDKEEVVLYRSCHEQDVDHRG